MAGTPVSPDTVRKSVTSLANGAVSPMIPMVWGPVDAPVAPIGLEQGVVP